MSSFQPLEPINLHFTITITATEMLWTREQALVAILMVCSIFSLRLMSTHTALVMPLEAIITLLSMCFSCIIMIWLTDNGASQCHPSCMTNTFNIMWTFIYNKQTIYFHVKEPSSYPG